MEGEHSEQRRSQGWVSRRSDGFSELGNTDSDSVQRKEAEPLIRLRVQDAPGDLIKPPPAGPGPAVSQSIF